MATREIQFLLCWPHPHAWRILWCLRSLSVETRKTLTTFFCCILHIYICKYRHIQIHNTGGLYCSGTNGLLTSDFGSSARGQRDNSYYADHTIWLHKRAAHLVMVKISVCRDPKKPTTSSSLNCMAETQLSACIVQCQLPTLCSDPNFPTLWSELNWIFFKIFHILSPSLLGMKSSTL